MENNNKYYLIAKQEVNQLDICRAPADRKSVV